MLMLPRICNYLGHLGFRNLVREDAAHTLSLGVHLEHNPSRLGAVHREEPLQNIHDELHGSIVVVDQHNLIQGRTLDLWRRFLDDQACSFPSAFRIAHDWKDLYGAIWWFTSAASKSRDAAPLSPF